VSTANAAEKEEGKEKGKEEKGKEGIFAAYLQYSRL
jgi:hypothetical protein